MNLPVDNSRKVSCKGFSGYPYRQTTHRGITSYLCCPIVWTVVICKSNINSNKFFIHRTKESMPFSFFFFMRSLRILDLKKLRPVYYHLLDFWEGRSLTVRSPQWSVPVCSDNMELDCIGIELKWSHTIVVSVENIE